MQGEVFSVLPGRDAREGPSLQQLHRQRDTVSDPGLDLPDAGP